MNQEPGYRERINILEEEKKVAEELDTITSGGNLAGMHVDGIRQVKKNIRFTEAQPKSGYNGYDRNEVEIAERAQAEQTETIHGFEFDEDGLRRSEEEIIRFAADTPDIIAGQQVFQATRQQLEAFAAQIDRLVEQRQFSGDQVAEKLRQMAAPADVRQAPRRASNVESILQNAERSQVYVTSPKPAKKSAIIRTENIQKHERGTGGDSSQTRFQENKRLPEALSVNGSGDSRIQTPSNHISANRSRVDNATKVNENTVHNDMNSPVDSHDEANNDVKNKSAARSDEHQQRANAGDSKQENGGTADCNNVSAKAVKYETKTKSGESRAQTSNSSKIIEDTTANTNDSLNRNVQRSQVPATVSKPGSSKKNKFSLEKAVKEHLANKADIGSLYTKCFVYLTKKKMLDDVQKAEFEKAVALNSLPGEAQKEVVILLGRYADLGIADTNIVDFISQQSNHDQLKFSPRVTDQSSNNLEEEKDIEKSDLVANEKPVDMKRNDSLDDHDEIDENNKLSPTESSMDEDIDDVDDDAKEKFYFTKLDSDESMEALVNAELTKNTELDTIFANIVKFLTTSGIAEVVNIA